MNNKTIILTSYFENPFNLKDQYNDNDFLICTDGGYDIAMSSGLKPDLLMGDFDSIKAALPEDIPIIKFNPVKDYTDLQLALDKAAELGADHVEIWGGIGGRLDQTVANIQLLASYCTKFKSLWLRDGKNEATAITGDPNRTYEFKEKNNWFLSLFSLTEKCSGLTVSGTKYTLDKYTIKNVYPIGVSNEFDSKNATIKFDSGTLLVILSKM